MLANKCAAANRLPAGSRMVRDSSRERVPGQATNSPNDATSDIRGRIYFTDARYGGTEPMELPNAVYRVDPNGKIIQLATDILRPNGIKVSPDSKRLYVLASNSPRLPTNPNGPAKDRFDFAPGGLRSTTWTDGKCCKPRAVRLSTTTAPFGSFGLPLCNAT